MSDSGQRRWRDYENSPRERHDNDHSSEPFASDGQHSNRGLSYSSYGASQSGHGVSQSGLGSRSGRGASLGGRGASLGGRGASLGGRGASLGGRGASLGGRGASLGGRGASLGGRGTGHNSHGSNSGAGGNSHGAGGTGPAGRHSTHFMSEEELQALSQSGPDEVLTFASHNETIFLNTFKRRHFCKHPLHLTRLIKLLHFLVCSDDKNFVATKLAQILSGDGEYATFMIEVDQLIKKMPFEFKEYIRRSNVACVGHLIQIGLEAIQVVPATVVFTFPVLALHQTIQDLMKGRDNLVVISRKFEGLRDAFEEEKRKRMDDMFRKAKPVTAPVDEPPEPFTEVAILPTIRELSIMSDKVYLRPNIVSGGYKSWDHYFDVQFRLLREDFVRPLRKGIAQYCDTGKSRGISDIRVYNNARILSPVCLFSGMGFDIKFDVSNLQNVNWEHSRRLIFGSMLCLSKDSFEKNVIFATVVKRDPSLLKEGKITIKFEGDSNPFAIDSNTTFKMVESTAYFEAYRYILERLQTLSEAPDTMPMKSYIVDCVNYREVMKVPGFMNLRTSRPVFNLKEIIQTRWPFDVTDSTKWPPAHTTDLDDSQLEALKVALTQEVAVIQGPPGTGKTYIGLKIAEAYLRNRSAWDPQKSSPIFVVCYTNHALDQFLEGIMNINGLEANIIRIGGRSKNEALSHCLLREKVQNARADRSIPGNVFKTYKDARADMIDNRDFIERMMKNCDAEVKNKIIGLHDLNESISEVHFSQLLYDRRTEINKEIEVWLELWFPEEYGEVPQQKEQPLFPEEPFFQEVHPGFQRHDEGTADGNESSEDDLIEVDNEAYVLENERMMAGVDIELPRNPFQQAIPKKEKKRNKKSRSQGDWSVVQLTQKKRNYLINQGFNANPMTITEVDRVDNVWSLPIQQRWSLYLYWMNQYIAKCKSQIHEAARTYNYACEVYNLAQRRIECHVALSADVIGMTTTGAAKYHHLLDGLRPKIAIFEEAAEVLEAHLVTSIASSVQQVILIGDHKQLRPKPTCYDLEKKFNLGISLFERLVSPSEKDGGFPYVTLEVQHRMRPEISKLVHPSIYKHLIDYKSVKEYGHIKGVSKDLFFICHTSPEEDNAFSDLKSHVNKFEADYAVQLCLYLLKQGYSPQEITILTMYRGQLLELRKRMKRADFEGVRVAAVDDFQGEENEIVILSLVRSNSENNIGFLSIENRVCVSLSRAKKGLYIIGNGHILKDRHDTKWPEIIQYLEEEHCFGRRLSLYCQNHPGDIKVIENPDDFKTRPEGGCLKTCGERLSCGHSCPRICHIRDSDHKSFRCTKSCNKQFSCGHFCKSKCFQCKQNGKCKPCSEHVEKDLLCGHRIKVKCSARIDQVPCPVPCSNILPCQHKCQNFCSEPCTTRCKAPALKYFPCGHQNEVECFKEPDEESCSHGCGATLECGDMCEGTCGSCKQGRLHVLCKKKCGRTLMCGHNCDFPCANICPPCNKTCNNYCIHSKCPKKCYEPCEPCMEQCEWNCPHFTCSKPCGQLCNRPPCDKPCYKTLECGHPCIGLCGERCPNKCLICDKDEVCAIFLGREEEEDAKYIQLQDCDHIFEVRDLDLWMNINAPTTKEEMVMFKACPRCKSSIRKSVRYGNQIKQVLLDVDAIKSKQQNDSSLLFDNHRNALRELEGLKNRKFVSNDMSALSQEIMDKDHQPDSFRAAAINLQLTILPSLLRLKNIADDCVVSDIQVSGYSLITATRDVFELKSFLMHRFLSAQQRSDITYELRQISCLVKLLDLFGKLTVKARSVSQQDLISITDLVKTLHQIVPSFTKVTEVMEAKCMDTIKTLSEHYHVNGLSDEERIQVVAAVGLAKGHWYKCPNGHFYCIGECGGATMTSKCPDCKATIGGSSHKLAEGNKHAGEMDSSSYAVYSDTANNLRNIDPAELARLRL